MRPRRPWAGLASWLLLTIAAVSARPLLADDAIVERLREPGAVLLIRHALAPGIGDPADFRLGDCATQRNLSEEGRQQARAIGRWLRAHGVGWGPPGTSATGWALLTTFSRAAAILRR